MRPQSVTEAKKFTYSISLIKNQDDAKAIKIREGEVLTTQLKSFLPTIIDNVKAFIDNMEEE